MAKLRLQQGRAQHLTERESKMGTRKSVFCNTTDTEINLKEEQHILKIAKSIIRIHREAFQELEKY